MSWIGGALARAMFLRRDVRGGCSRLEDGVRATLLEKGILPPEEEKPRFDDEFGPRAAAAAPLAQVYDFVEIGAGVSWEEGGSALGASLPRELHGRGYQVGPLFDRGRDPGWSEEDPVMMEWLFWLVAQRRVRYLHMNPSLGVFCVAHLRIWERGGGDHRRRQRELRGFWCASASSSWPSRPACLCRGR